MADADLVLAPESSVSTKTIDLVDSEEINEDVIQISSNQALISSLLLAFTYVISGDQVDLGELSIKGNPICAGWKGYRNEGGDLAFDDECGSCQNVWKSCEHNDNTIMTIQAFNFVASLCFIGNVCINVFQIQLFAKMPKSGAKMLYIELGRVITKLLPNATICIGLMAFTIAFFLQMSLTVPPEVFWPLFICGLLLVFFLGAMVCLMNIRANRVKLAMKSKGIKAS